MAVNSNNDDEDDVTYIVVVNHEQQYSIWPASHDVPAGWNSAGKIGQKNECLDYIESVWTDMRPLSLRQQIEEMQQASTTHYDSRSNTPASADTGPSLVERLCMGRHAVVADVEPPTAAALRECIDRAYVHVMFPETSGGTTLGIDLDPLACNTSTADFHNQTGSIHLEGQLTLNGIRVRCICDLDLATLTGEGHLSTVNT